LKPARRSRSRPALPALRQRSSRPMCYAPSAFPTRSPVPRSGSASAVSTRQRRSISRSTRWLPRQPGSRARMECAAASAYPHNHRNYALEKRMRARQQALRVTDAAAQRIQALLAKRGKPSAGIRIGVRSRGCSGLSYTLEYADEKGKFDEVVEDKGVTVLIDPKAVMFILGTEMDYVEEKLQNGFTFSNPNEKGRCGCGESFHV